VASTPNDQQKTYALEVASKGESVCTNRAVVRMNKAARFMIFGHP
jgi:hypothetical protein